jgi:hypothetical protein
MDRKTNSVPASAHFAVPRFANYSAQFDDRMNADMNVPDNALKRKEK